MDKHFDYQKLEPEILKLWEEKQVANPDKNGRGESGKSFCIILPPPNANDPLHLGHAMYVVEDVLIRQHRMLGDDTLWLPGTDHAGIETQFVYEKKLKKQGKSRFDFDRDTLYKQIAEYVAENSETAREQLKTLGFSLDWSRFVFVLDKKPVELTLETFVRMHRDDLIYRDLRLVNYCPKCGTGFSELEINHEQRKSKLYYLQYGPFEVATTRPETIFGDLAVAVHPSDKRYKKFIGQEVEVDFLHEKRKLKVVADEAVDLDFGTGALKITPYHDHTDYEIWQRHKDELATPRQVIELSGRLNDFAGEFSGLKAHVAREKVAEKLEEKGLLLKVDDDYQNNVSSCYRCKNAIEPLPLPQFYVKVTPLIKPVLEGLEKNEVIIHGAGHDKTLKHWLSILKDWNISRQIVWGIRIPAWYSLEENPKLELIFIDKEGNRQSGQAKELLTEFSLEEIKEGLQELKAPINAKYIVSTESPGKDYLQETDTFDTWFSSGQWPVNTLKSTREGDFERFYPSSVMETAYDILMFWVMRMLMFGYYLTGKTPFEHVYLHGLIRDNKGLKMSKSKGNVINPLEVVEKFGADALRMALVIRSSAGLDKSVSEQDFKAMKHFANKIWNASRYLIEKDNKVSNLSKADEAFDKKLEKLKKEIAKNFEKLQVGLAADTLYNEFWHWFCDDCLEKNKSGELSDETLLAGLKVFLKLLHPFMPFVTESVWQELLSKNPKSEDSSTLALAHWPLSS